MKSRLTRVSIDSPLYPAERALRYEVLRKPLGQPPGSEVFPYEAESLHWVALDEAGEVCGCVLFHRDDDGPQGRLFQMAVRADRRRHGLGRALVEHLEREVAALGVRRVYLHARADVTGFYASLGYREVGAPFVEVGIEHRGMEKTLG